MTDVYSIPAAGALEGQWLSAFPSWKVTAAAAGSSYICKSSPATAASRGAFEWLGLSLKRPLPFTACKTKAGSRDLCSQLPQSRCTGNNDRCREEPCLFNQSTAAHPAAEQTLCPGLGSVTAPSAVSRNLAPRGRASILSHERNQAVSEGSIASGQAEFWARPRG